MNQPPPFLRSLRRVADEPLAQFLAIGLALFAADRLTAVEVADPNLIRVDAAAYDEIVGIYAGSRGRAPTEDEIVPLVDQWIMNETLYREARALGLDQGDEMVRERVMQKLRVLMHSAITVEEPDPAVLRAWFEQNRSRYAQPELLSIRIAQVDGDEVAAAAMADRLNAVFAGETRLASGEVVVLPFPDRPRPVLEQVLGVEVVAAVAALQPGRWTPVRTPGGWQAALFEGATPGAETDFDAIATTVSADWREETFRRAARQSIEALMASYRVERAPYDPADWAEAAALAVDPNRPEPFAP